MLGLVGLLAAPAEARKRHHPKPSGVEGAVLSSTTCIQPCVPCDVPCAQPLAEAVYTGEVSVTVSRTGDRAQVASGVVTDGKFRFKLPRGAYDVTVVPPTVVPPPCPPGLVCIADPARPSIEIANCLGGESRPVQVRRHRFTHVDLHVTNLCVAQAA